MSRKTGDSRQTTSFLYNQFLSLVVLQPFILYSTYRAYLSTVYCLLFTVYFHGSQPKLNRLHRPGLEPR